jgi:hypothetical protein
MILEKGHRQTGPGCGDPFTTQRTSEGRVDFRRAYDELSYDVHALPKEAMADLLVYPEDYRL